jgi:hypothetical protein
LPHGVLALRRLHRGPTPGYHQFEEPFPLFSLPSLHHTLTQEREQSAFFMSSNGQTTFSHSTVQSIIDALVDYTKVTGIDLSNNPFVAAIEHANSPEAILVRLQERGNTFKEYRDGNRRLISSLRPAVKVIHSFSSILGEAAGLVSYTCHPGDPLNVTSLGPVSTSKRFVCWHRYSPCCTSFECVFQPVPL